MYDWLTHAHPELVVWPSLDFFDLLSSYKEGRFRLIFLQQIQDILRVLSIRSIIKSVGTSQTTSPLFT